MMARVIRSKISGVTFPNPDGSDRQAIIRRHVRDGMSLRAIPEPKNPRDKHAVGLWVLAGRRWRQIGYIGSELAHDLRGESLQVNVLERTGGGRGMSYGVNIEITLVEPLPRRQVAASVKTEAVPAATEPSFELFDAGAFLRRHWQPIPDGWHGIVATYRALPDWAVPIVWGLGIGGLVVAAVIVSMIAAAHH